MGISVKIQDIIKITNEKFLNLYKIKYTDRNNQDKNWIFASRQQDVPSESNERKQAPDAVVIVPFHKIENKLVIIKEFRPVLQGCQYSLPAGLVEKGEPIAETAQRELFEETGLSLTRVISQSPATYVSAGLTDETICLMHVECEGTPSRQFLEDSEDIEVLMVSPREAEELLANKDIHFDVKAWLILKNYASSRNIFGDSFS